MMKLLNATGGAALAGHHHRYTKRRVLYTAHHADTLRLRAAHFYAHIRRVSFARTREGAPGVYELCGVNPFHPLSSYRTVGFCGRGVGACVCVYICVRCVCGFGVLIKINGS